jgi:hypothetical protein
MSSNEASPHCLNCGADLAGPYCSQCGQEDNELRVSLKRLFRDFLAEQVGLETKVPTTLWKLVSRPGLLTKEYLAGKRVRSLLPLRLYLSASVIYFLLLSLPGVGADLDKQVKITGIDSAAIDSPSREKAANSNMTITVPGAKISGNANGTLIERFVRKRSERFKAMSPVEAINYFKAAFIKYMPNAIFLLLPAFAFILYLLYRKTGRFFAEHLIFALHVHAFAFVALILGLILPDALDIVVPVWILVYLFMALRKVYGDSRRRTAAKFAVLLFTYMLTLQITLLALLGIIFAVG